MGPLVMRLDKNASGLIKVFYSALYVYSIYTAPGFYMIEHKY